MGKVYAATYLKPPGFVETFSVEIERFRGRGVLCTNQGVPVPDEAQEFIELGTFGVLTRAVSVKIRSSGTPSS